MLLVLGLNAFHADAAAALYRDGRLVAAVEEERLNRIKHCAGFPALAVQEVLRIGGVGLEDLDEVAIARDGRANLRQRAAYVLRNLRGITRVARKRLKDRAGLADLETLLCEACGRPRHALRARVQRVEHHLAHAASAFLPSSFERAAVLTMDGFGDFASALWGVGEGNRIRPLGRVTYPHSLGILYTAICQFIGFDRYGDEGKVMGLAPFGKPSYAEFFSRLLRLTDTGYELDLEYFTHHTEGVETGKDEYGSPSFAPLYSPALARKFGPPRVRGAELAPRDLDLAASLQQRLEEAFLHLARLLQRRTGLTDLCLAGGVTLNGVANGKLLEHSGFSRLWVQPAAGDDGTAVGAAALLCAQAGHPRHEMIHAGWGSSFSREEIRRELAAAAAEHSGEFEIRELPEAVLLDQTAALVAEGKVVGWFQGAMEWGPRALGHRSIVAHPGHPGMKDILNARIKQREAFRPFAPSILAERLPEYFESSHPSPFMLLVYRTRQEKREALCAVDHVDHTGRVQTVTRDQNPRYYGLIEAFERRTGLPVLLNTSFNENEPIVCTPREALECFLRTRMDAVALGDFLCLRRAAAAAPAAAEAGRARA
ncbi:MAG: carbamoyltransferase [Planctomycetes bacterium]|nr:carbamoyltransferase [Planctomycetota bacterium]